jgi:DNA-binding PadR family transcriptional regulator
VVDGATLSALHISTVVISNAKRAQTDDEHEPTVPLTPAVFHILLALVDGESHGYGIMQDVERFTNGETRLGPGTLYRSIQRMLVDELIEELPIALHDESDDDRRRYYRLTKKGHAVARREAQRLADLVEAARQRDLLTSRSTRGHRR